MRKYAFGNEKLQMSLAPAGGVLVFLVTVGAYYTGERMQAAQSRQTTVSLSYALPRQITRHAPVSLIVRVANDTTETVHVDLGPNSEGYSQLSVTLPSGANVPIDPRKPPKSRRTVARGDFDIAPKGRRTVEIVLNDWIDFSSLGVYRVQVEFIGSARSSRNAPIDIQRVSMPLFVEVLPRNPQELRNIAERLVRQIQSPPAAPAMLAYRKLVYLDDPIAIPYWIRILEWRGTRFDGQSIRALEKFGTPEARAAIERASTHADPRISDQALDALLRLNQR